MNSDECKTFAGASASVEVLANLFAGGRSRDPDFEKRINP